MGPRLEPKAGCCHDNMSWDHAVLRQIPGYEDRAMLGSTDKIGAGKEASHQSQENPRQMAANAAHTVSPIQPALRPWAKASIHPSLCHLLLESLRKIAIICFSLRKSLNN